MSEQRCDPGFQQLLAQHFSLDLLEQHPGTVYGLWPDLTLAYMNPAWFDFARENNGEPAISTHWQRGRVITDALPDVLHPYYVELYLRALEEANDNPLNHSYECSSPKQFRRFSMSVHNLGYGAGLLIINRDEQVSEHWRSVRQALDGVYRDSAGYLQQCSHCRCFQHSQQPERWDWIPDWLRHPPANITYSLCPDCFQSYYGLSA